MTDQATLNILWADQLIAGLAAGGVRRAVISPGSRSTPLVLACQRHPEIETHLVIDERCASFFALGMSRHSNEPSLVIATSGSAPAHWYPAIIEARQSGIPLLFVSADRPPELHYCGANQTVEQQEMFGRHVVASFQAGTPVEHPDALAAIFQLGIKAAHMAVGATSGPVHINQPFREPLIPAVLPPQSQPVITVAAPCRAIDADPLQVERIRSLIQGRPGLLISGQTPLDLTEADLLAALAQQINAPIMADPLGNLRFGPHDRSMVLSRYDCFLRDTDFVDAAIPEWIIQIGRLPVSKPLQQYLQRHRPDTVLLASGDSWPDPLHNTVERVYSTPGRFLNALLECRPDPAPHAWSHAFLRRELLVEQQFMEQPLPPEGRIISELLHLLPEHSTLFSGNSMPIRQIDSWSGSSEKAVRIIANRGASGIDGNISTVLGLARHSSRPIVAVMGDLTFYHDMNGLLNSRDINAVIILINNGGGAIFGYLPQARLDTFEQHWLTPHGLQFEHAAKLYNLGYQRVEQPDGFAPALCTALAEQGLSLIEILIDREQSQRLHRQFWEAAIKDPLSE